MPDGGAEVAVVGVDVDVGVAVEWERLRADALIQSCLGVFCSLRRTRRLVGGCKGDIDCEGEGDTDSGRGSS